MPLYWFECLCGTKDCLNWPQRDNVEQYDSFWKHDLYINLKVVSKLFLFKTLCWFECLGGAKGCLNWHREIMISTKMISFSQLSQLFLFMTLHRFECLCKTKDCLNWPQWDNVEQQKSRFKCISPGKNTRPKFKPAIAI